VKCILDVVDLGKGKTLDNWGPRPATTGRGGGWLPKARTHATFLECEEGAAGVDHG
jgi:hypothetical protein